MQSSSLTSGFKGEPGAFAATRRRSFLIKLDSQYFTDQKGCFLSFDLLAGQFHQSRLSLFDGLPDLLVESLGVAMAFALNGDRHRAHAQGQFDAVHGFISDHTHPRGTTDLVAIHV